MIRRIRELTAAINMVHQEFAQLVAQVAPQLLAEPGVRVLIAAKLIGEIAGAGPGLAALDVRGAGRPGIRARPGDRDPARRNGPMDGAGGGNREQFASVKRAKI